ncbi:hypothetical protein Sango_2716700 [Sesamum angolense]|uniref:Uncharacterized protein n=1 Tax=Sesamum angolense TaxID=2727404 RepID=A0AAE1W3A1_9LAMI|nr:hypothetical protein Sango_2716700 [Sesamum angolense]
MDLDLGIREDSPPALTDKSTSEQKREKERWENPNRMSVLIMKKSILEAFRDTMPETLTKAKDFLEHIEKRFVKNVKVEIGTLLTNLISKGILEKEEERLKQDKTECAYFASTSKGKDNGNKREKDNGAANTTPQKKQQKESNDSNVVCYFCKAEGHIKSTAPTFTHGVLRKVCLSCQKPIVDERYIYVGDGKVVLVEDFVPNSVDGTIDQES